jgi:hypothetical protein
MKASVCKINIGFSVKAVQVGIFSCSTAFYSDVKTIPEYFSY